MGYIEIFRALGFGILFKTPTMFFVCCLIILITFGIFKKYESSERTGSYILHYIYLILIMNYLKRSYFNKKIFNYRHCVYSYFLFHLDNNFEYSHFQTEVNKSVDLNKHLFLFDKLTSLNSFWVT